MKKFVLGVSLLLVLFVVGYAFFSAGSPGNDDSSSSLPKALDSFYPPKASEPVWLMRMYGMSMSFAGILSDLFEGDTANVLPNFNAFKSEYTAISKLVPEWEKNFPTAPMAELGNALAGGQQEAVMKAYESMGKVCYSCHVEYMTPVQQKYHWGNYHDIQVQDPLTQEQVNFTRLMQYLDVSFVGVFVDANQNQPENCQKQFQGFKARFKAMIDTCEECHGTSERKYYVDDEIMKTIDNLEGVINTSPFDAKKALSLGMEIGMESCHKCHLVHGPSGLAQAKWRQ